jgi:serine/threonine-protein kinase SRPK3
MTTPSILVRQMLGTVDDDLPDHWQTQWHVMNTASSNKESTSSPQTWLEEMYFDGERSEDLSWEDIARFGSLIRSMLRLEPSARASSKVILQDPWFQKY